jgi:hypothetical protein
VRFSGTYRVSSGYSFEETREFGGIPGSVIAVPGLDPGIDPAIRAQRLPGNRGMRALFVTICFIASLRDSGGGPVIIIARRVDGRVKPGHDNSPRGNALGAAFLFTKKRNCANLNFRLTRLKKERGDEQRAGGGGEAEMKKSFRETHSPLKSLKTAKSGDFRVQRYQRLSKTHDFVGETFSFRFARLSFRGNSAIPIWRRRAPPGRSLKSLENPSTRQNSFLRLATP